MIRFLLPLPAFMYVKLKNVILFTDRIIMTVNQCNNKCRNRVHMT